MSKNEKQNLTENECESDDEQVENKVESATSDNTVRASRGSPRITNHTLQQAKTEGSEVHPNDVIIVQQLSHESLSEESSSENLEYKVIYEFPSEDENKSTGFSKTDECKVTSQYLKGHEGVNASYLPEACVVPSHNISLNEESPDNTDIAGTGTSRESERKRKKDPLPLLQSKKHKDLESSSIPVTHSACGSGGNREDENSRHSSDEFADIEDNIKDSFSSDNSDSNTTTKTTKQMQMKKFTGNLRENEVKDKFIDENKSMKVNYEALPLNSNNSPNNKSVDKAAKKSNSSLKGEKIPAINLSDDQKKKFEISMPTIFEVRESDSDEQILQPKKSNSNPLIMKTSVVKRKDRCNICNVRLGLCAIRCRCGGYYCAKHRYDKEHNCTFDYKSMGAAEIVKNNPRIVAEKVRKL